MKNGYSRTTMVPTCISQVNNGTAHLHPQPSPFDLPPVDPAPAPPDAPFLQAAADSTVPPACTDAADAGAAAPAGPARLTDQEVLERGLACARNGLLFRRL